MPKIKFNEHPLSVILIIDINICVHAYDNIQYYY